MAASVDETDWDHIVLLYDVLTRVAPSPVVELNRAAAVSMASGPAAALEIVDSLVGHRAFRDSHLLLSVRAELLKQLGRIDEARADFTAAAAAARNDRGRQVLRSRAATLRPRPGSSGAHG